MELLILGVGGVVFLAVLGIVVARAGAALRVAVAIVAVVLVAVCSFEQGAAYQRVLFHSSYVYWVDQYSAHLAELARAGDCEELGWAVLRFEERMGDKPDDAAALEDAMHEILKVGRYYGDSTNVSRQPTSAEAVDGPR